MQRLVVGCGRENSKTEPSRKPPKPGPVLSLFVLVSGGFRSVVDDDGWTEIARYIGGRNGPWQRQAAAWIGSALDLRCAVRGRLRSVPLTVTDRRDVG
jgi:hypothetical protein